MNAVFRVRIGVGHRKVGAEPQIIVSKAGRRKGVGLTFLPDVVRTACNWEPQDSNVISGKSRPLPRAGPGFQVTLATARIRAI